MLQFNTPPNEGEGSCDFPVKLLSSPFIEVPSPVRFHYPLQCHTDLYIFNCLLSHQMLPWFVDFCHSGIYTLREIQMLKELLLNAEVTVPFITTSNFDSLWADRSDSTSTLSARVCVHAGAVCVEYSWLDETSEYFLMCLDSSRCCRQSVVT